MNEQIHEELNKLKKELSRLDSATKEIEKSKTLSKEIVESINISKNGLMEKFENISTIIQTLVKTAEDTLNNNLESVQDKLNTAEKDFKKTTKETGKSLKDLSDEIKSFSSSTQEILSNAQKDLQSSISDFNKLVKEINDINLASKLDKFDASIANTNATLSNLQGIVDKNSTRIEKELERNKNVVISEMNNYHNYLTSQLKSIEEHENYSNRTFKRFIILTLVLLFFLLLTNIYLII